MDDIVKLWVGIGVGVLILVALLTGIFSIIDFFTLVGWPAIITVVMLFFTLILGIVVFLDIQENKKITKLSLSLPIFLGLFLATIYIVWQIRLPNAMPTLVTAKEFGPEKAGLYLSWWSKLLPEEEEKKVTNAITGRLNERRKQYHFQAVQDFDATQYRASTAYRSGNCKMVWMDDARPTGGFNSPVLENNIEEASCVVWLEIKVEKIGKYYIESDILLKKKVVHSAKVTYRAYVVDVNTEKVSAFSEFVGPKPPLEISVKQIFPALDYDRASDVYGIAPTLALVSWLESLPTKAVE